MSNGKRRGRKIRQWEQLVKEQQRETAEKVTSDPWPKAAAPREAVFPLFILPWGGSHPRGHAVCGRMVCRRQICMDASRREVSYFSSAFFLTSSYSFIALASA